MAKTNRLPSHVVLQAFITVHNVTPFGSIGIQERRHVSLITDSEAFTKLMVPTDSLK